MSFDSAADIPLDELEMIQRIENAIVGRLQTLTDVGATRIEAHPPEDPSGKPVPKGLLQVAYVQSRWSRPKSRVAAVQEEEMQFQLSWRFRDLRTHQESYKLIRATYCLLKDFAPFDCWDSVLYPLAAELIEQDEQGFWTFYMMFGYQIPSL